MTKASSAIQVAISWFFLRIYLQASTPGNSFVLNEVSQKTSGVGTTKRGRLAQKLGEENGKQRQIQQQ